MVDMLAYLDKYYFWLTLTWIFSGIVAYVAGFITCFLFCNYHVVKKEVITND